MTKMEEEKPAQHPGPRPLFLIRRIRDAMNKSIARHFRKLHLTPALGEVLQAVALEGEASSSALARRLGITPQSIKQSIHSLERLDYVQRTLSATDQRVLKVELTDKGGLALHRCLEAIDEMYEEIFGPLKPREMENLSKLLIKVVRVIDPETIELYRDRRIASSN